VFGYSMGAATGLQLAIRHPEKVNKLVSASGGYDAEGWQPAFKAFIPQMTVEIFVNIPFAADYKKLAPNPNGFPELVRKLIAIEKEPMAWEADVKALKTPVLIVTGDADVGDARNSVPRSDCSAAAAWVIWAGRCRHRARRSCRRRRIPPSSRRLTC
jgi:pimeloyl-ACP methyl ester carboxylesterase